jgi:biopolymer transport protein ExbD
MEPRHPTADDDAVEPVLARRRKLEEADMDITPMIDMTFLLLIFFLVSAKMGPKAGVELPQARHGGSVATQNAIILTVGPGEPMARVYRGESVAPKDAFGGGNIEAQEAEIITYIEDQYAQGANSNEPKTAVLIQAAGALKHREVARVIKAASRAEIDQLYVGVVEKKK